MPGGAQLSVTDQRRAARHPVNLPVIGEHRRLGDVMLTITNLSANGFMIQGQIELGRGERVTVRLPQIGRIEAFLVWNADDRAGFQFERIIRQDDFMKLLRSLQPNSRLRPAR
ncbi:PilZ domain-containing protein [Novosphingobium cyanobacteriorum]|uniref:PilZ domain-containing protein n=1 Tax=Novosphingobium cyanobacteriorum TaxID=3024215 RepID=A0ABT6CNC2_9SPHN|nr:PilZ domain-containing protein [Novosphingobium cyanobacteriorum]MDF8335413.1 PilZ domain-containing protein [Novosphingobium cyanobacteriorum]